MTPQATKELMDHVWSHRGVRCASNRTARRADGDTLVPSRGRPTGLVRLPRRYLPLYRQPRLGLPNRPRKRAATKHWEQKR